MLDGRKPFSHEWFDPGQPKSLTQRQLWVFGVIEEGTGSLRIYTVGKPNGTAIAQILDTIVEPYTIVHSDAHPMYKTIDFERMRIANIIHIHKNKRDLFHSSYIEGVWWILKQSIRKMYG